MAVAVNIGLGIYKYKCTKALMNISVYQYVSHSA